MDPPKDANAGGDGTDDSSIKPVSSLLSQFENLTAAKDTPTKSQPTSSARQPSSQTQDARSPLEKPKFSSHAQKLLETSSRNQGHASLDTSDSERKPPPAPAPRRRGVSPSQALQPLSLSKETDAPATLHPPQVNVISPRSPPKTITIPRDVSSFRTHQGPFTPSGIRSASPNAPPVQLEISNREVDPRRSPSLQALDLPSSLAGKKPNVSVSGDFKKGPSVEKMGPPLPPPFNRAAKPKIGVNKTDTSNMPVGLVDSISQEVSPFNTPPSSGEEFSNPGSPPPIPKMSKPRQVQTTHKQESYFEPASKSQIRSASHGGSNSPRSHDVRYVSQPIYNGKSSKYPTDDTTEVKPMLPPRRESTAVSVSRPVPLQPEGQVRRSMDSPAKSSALTQGFGSLSTSSRARPSQEISRASISAPGNGPSRSLTTERANINSRQPVEQKPIDHGRLQPTVSDISSLRNPTPPPRPQIGTQRAPSPLKDIGNEYPFDTIHLSEYPDLSQTNRRPPHFSDGPRTISTGVESKTFSVCGEHICVTGVMTRVWNLLTGKLLLSMNHGENVKVTAISFKPARKIEDEGNRLWLGTNWGELLEVDIATKKIVASNNNVHNRRELIKIYRHATELWTLDDEGKICVWPSNSDGSPNFATAVLNPRIPRGQTCSLIVGNQLWVAFGKDIKIFQPTTKPDANIQVLTKPLGHPHTGDITASAILPNQPDWIYFGDKDGKVSIYSIKDFSCLAVYNVSAYRFSSMVGIGDYLWAGFNTGKIYVYDTTTVPWTVKKDWQAHGAIASIVADRSSIWKLDRLQVLSLGTDSTIGIWDGMLQSDWLDDEMLSRQPDYCTTRDLTCAVVTWNAGASRPMDLRYDQKDSNFFREAFNARQPPDIIVCGLQELVDLEDKKLTAKSFFKSKSKDPYGQEHLSSVYRDWRDSLRSFLDETMPVSENYSLLQTANLVGLFTCVFIKTSHRLKIRDLQVAEIKTGMGGLHGNKGAIIVRFILDDSSLCFVNCHLAAGQTQTQNRNNDVASILEAAPLLHHDRSLSTQSLFVGGGDGSMIMDHEICILNGDLNYRIDTLPRDSIISAIRSSNFPKLLERDQLLLCRRKYPGFRLRAFTEAPIAFMPTYKYDVGTDNYDSSEKRRAPAWCDRILYRGGDRVHQLEYRRHEVRVSDHRPVSALFSLRIKSVQMEKRQEAWNQCEAKFEQVKQNVCTDAKLDYLTHTFGLDVKAAKRLLD